MIVFADEVVRAAATQQAATSAFLRSLHKSKVSTIQVYTQMCLYVHMHVYCMHVILK